MSLIDDVLLARNTCLELDMDTGVHYLLRLYGYLIGVANYRVPRIPVGSFHDDPMVV